MVEHDDDQPLQARAVDLHSGSTQVRQLLRRGVAEAADGSLALADGVGRLLLEPSALFLVVRRRRLPALHLDDYAAFADDEDAIAKLARAGTHPGGLR